MKFAVSLVLTALLALGFGLYLPWWSVAAAGFIIAVLFRLKPLFAFLSGFTAIFLCWGILAWIRSIANEDILGSKMAMLILKSENTFLLVIITALIGAITAGLASLSGSLLRSVIKTNKQGNLY